MSDTINIDCPQCGSTLAVPNTHLDAKLQCWSCETKFFYADLNKASEAKLEDLLFQEEYGETEIDQEVESVVEQLSEPKNLKLKKLKSDVNRRVIQAGRGREESAQNNLRVLHPLFWRFYS